MFRSWTDPSDDSSDVSLLNFAQLINNAQMSYLILIKYNVIIYIYIFCFF